MAEIITSPEIEKQDRYIFNPEARQVDDIEVFMKTGLQDVKNEINAIVRTTINKNRRDLFGAEVSELYIKLLEKLNTGTRAQKEQEKIKKFLQEVEAHIDTKMKPYGERFEFRKEGILAEYCAMRYFQKFLRRNVFISAELDSNYKIDFEVETSENSKLLVQIKSSNELNGIALGLGKDAPDLEQNTTQSLRSCLRPNGKMGKFSQTLSDVNLQNIFSYIQKQKSEISYKPVILAFPSVLERNESIFDQFGEPTARFIAMLDQKLGIERSEKK